MAKAIVIGDTVICQDSIATLTAVGEDNYRYEWLLNGVIASTHDTLITEPISGITIYQLVIHDEVNRCPDTMEVSVRTTGRPIFTIRNNTRCSLPGDGGIAVLNPEVGSFTYTINPIGNTPEDVVFPVNTLSAQQYIIVSTDAGCVITDTITIEDRLLIPTVTMSKSDVSRPDGNDGQAIATPAGGTPGYTYSWNPSPSINSIADNLSRGMHTVIVTDSKGCTVTDSIELIDYTPFEFEVQLVKNSCFEQNDGILEVKNLRYGIAPFTLKLYTMDGVQVGSTQTWPNGVFANVTPGSYQFIIEDATSYKDTSDMLTVQELPEINVSLTVTAPNPILYGQQVAIEAQAAISPVSYQWNTSPASTINAIDGDSLVLVTVIHTNTTVTVTVSDAFGCIEMDTIMLQMKDCASYNDVVDLVNNNDIYSVVGLVGLCWFRENFKGILYADSANIPFAEGYDHPQVSPLDENIEVFGRLYTWESATRGQNPEVASFSSTQYVTNLALGLVQGVCPKGWRLPNTNEWQRLANTYAAAELRSTDYWLEPNTNTNSTTFTALPAGYYNGSISRFEKLYVYTSFWSCNKDSHTGEGLGATLNKYCSNLEEEIITISTSTGLSVRCVAVIPATALTIKAARHGNEATLYGGVTSGDEMVESVTFEYKTTTSADWISVPAALSGDVYTYSLSGLSNTVTYEYRIVVKVQGEETPLYGVSKQF